MPAISPIMSDENQMPKTNDPETKDVAFWDRLAPKYVKTRISDAQGYENTLNRVSGLLKDTDDVLELGCGTGSTAIRLAPFCRHYLATDISPGMIAQGQAVLSRTPIANLKFEAATAGSLRTGSQEFDAILGFNYLHLVASLPDTLTNAHALLNTGGLLITKTPCMKDMSAFFRLAIAVALPLMRVFGKAPEMVVMLNKADLLGAIKTAGFEIEAVEWHATTKTDPRPFIVARKM